MVAFIFNVRNIASLKRSIFVLNLLRPWAMDKLSQTRPPKLCWTIRFLGKFPC